MSLDTAICSTALADKSIKAYFEALDSPRALTCWLLFSSGEHDQLAALDFDPFLYNSKEDAFGALAATKFLSKADFLRTSYDRREKALQKFFEAEKSCIEANHRIRRGYFRCATTHTVLACATRVINGILGHFEPDELIDCAGWGPGATTSINRRESSAPKKYEFETHITPSAHDFVADWFHLAYPLWGEILKSDKMKLVDASKVVTVPKNSKTDRTIAIEPGLNLWFQKGIGKMIRRRLHRVGIDLNDQGHNQRLAMIASRENELATIDFSAASDTVSIAIVEELLPPRWLTLLKAFRSSYCNFEGKLIRLEKFSSMGNGFTFELESLIFYALAIASCKAVNVDTSDVSVFGDDVILPSSAASLYSDICADLGFSVNDDKSYVSSYYRESCGSHYWDSEDIKPIFLKKEPNGKSEILKFANNVRRIAHRLCNIGCDRRFRRCWHLLASSLGKGCPRISEGFGDLALIVNFNEVRDPKRAPNGYEGFLVPVWGLIPRTVYMDGPGVLLQKLRRLGRNSSDGNDLFSYLESEGRGDGNDVPLSCRTKVAKFRILVPRWYDLGPWL